MSTSVFTQCDGAVYAVKLQCVNDAAAVFQIKFDTKMLDVPVTAFALEQGGNFQFLHTINNFVYAYVFGDRIGELLVSGMGFVSSTACAPAVNTGSLRSLYTFYKDNRLANKKRALVVSLGDCGAFWAFLTGMRMEISRADVLIGQWSLRFNVLPKPATPPPAFGLDVTYGGRYGTHT